MSHIIAPSILAADFGKLSAEVEMINGSEAQWIHVDIMDGVFVPNISFGFPVVEAINKAATKPLDVHLMIVDPDRYVEQFKNAGAEILTVHYEVCSHLHRSMGHIKEHGMKAGIALNPHTPVSLLEAIVEEADLICLMSVNPGFGGQKFIENTYRKIEQLRTIIDKKSLSTKIEIDGGVNANNAKKLLDCGADVLVAGSFVFSAQNPVDTIKNLVAIG